MTGDLLNGPSRRATHLTVWGAARFAIPSYSAPVTFVLIEWVRGFDMERLASENRANIRPVSELLSFQWLPSGNFAFYLEAEVRGAAASRLPSRSSETDTKVSTQHPAGGDVSNNSRCAAAFFEGFKQLKGQS